ncbi:MAG: hypothetical protein H6822_28210 [Planctomycetaceae bacterium]|nr:hypothetical protein [Planctomycetales bacterium]MCB9926066.1 hypothetical protein [Planctomycetaceae bacterium]
MPRPPITFGRIDRLAVLTLLLIGLIVYVNCLTSAFVFDDLLFIDGQALDISSANWLAPQIDLPIKGRPLVGLSFVLNYSISGTNPAGYHAFNLTVHLMCAVMLFSVVRQAMLRWSQERQADSALIAVASALLWMIHPLQTECVNYVSQRSESMAALFILLSLYCAIRACETQYRGRWIVAAGASCWTAVCCKEIAAVGPMLIILLDATFSPSSIRILIRERWRLYATVCSCWIPLASLLYLLPRSATVGVSDDVSVTQYALNQSLLIIQYFRLVVWPDALVIDYGRPREVAWLEAAPAVIAISTVLLTIAIIYRRRPVIGYLALAVVLLLAPTSSFLPITSEVGAERRLYLPLAAMVVLIVLGLWTGADRFACYCRRRGSNALPIAWLSSPIATRGLTLGLVLPAALMLSLRSIDRNREYADPLKLWTQAVEARPDNPRAWTWLAFEFSRVDRATAKRVTGEMVSRWCGDWSVLFDAGEAYLCLHRDPTEAARCFRRVLQLEPDHAKARLRLVWLLAGCEQDELRNGKEALRIAQHLQEKYPHSVEVLDALAIAHAECGDFDTAIAVAEQALACSEQLDGIATKIRDRISGYRAHQPFRFDAT